MRRKLRIATAILVFGTLAWAPPADAAAPANATTVVSGSLGARRAVAWESTDGVIYAQRLGTDGTPQGAPIEVIRDYPGDYGSNSTGPYNIAVGPNAIAVSSTYEQGCCEPTSRPEIAVIKDNGDHLYTHLGFCELVGAPPGAVAWNGSVFMLAGQCYSDTGMQLRTGTFDPVTDESARIDGPAVTPDAVSVTALGAGFAVAWQQTGATGDDLDVYAQRYDALGHPVGTPVQVAVGSGDQMQPTIAASGNRYLIAWITGAGRDIAARTMTTTGNLGTAKPLVNAAGNQNHPWLAPGSNGGWHLAWSDLRSGNNDVYAAKVSSTLGVTPANGRIVAGGSGPQNAPTVSTRPNGAAFVAYLDRGIGKVQDLTAAGAPTGEAKTVTVSPK